MKIRNWKNNLSKEEKKELEKNENLKTLGFEYIGKDRDTKVYKRGNVYCFISDGEYRFDTAEELNRRTRELYNIIPTIRQ